MSGKLLGLTGKAGAGKDYTYDLLTYAFSNIQRIAFADEVRFEIDNALKLPHYASVFWDKPYSEEVRALLQWWGTDYRRSQDPEYWLKKARASIVEALDWADLVVLTDVRFANEADLVRNLGGIVAEVVADEEVRRQRLGGTLPPAHASEDIDFPVDAVIHNQQNGCPPRLPGFVTRFIGLPGGLSGRHPGGA